MFVKACINTIWYNKSFFDCVCQMLWGLVNCLTICLSLLSVSRFVICWYQLASTPAGQQNLPFFYTFIHPSFSFADSICHFLDENIFFPHNTTLYLHKWNEKKWKYLKCFIMLPQKWKFGHYLFNLISFQIIICWRTDFFKNLVLKFAEFSLKTRLVNQLFF